MPGEQPPIPTVMRNIRSTLNRLSTLAAVLTIAVSLVPVVASPAAAATDKPILLGLASQNVGQSLSDFTQQAGRPPAIYQRFWPIEAGWPNGWAPAELSTLADAGAVAYIEVTTDDLGGLNRGDKDQDLARMAKTIGDWLKAAPNRHILIGPLPEMNLNSSNNPWGGNPDGYKAGYNRIREAFLDQGLSPDQIRFFFAPNGTSDVGKYDDYYPGDSVVDLIGFAKINRGDPWRDYDVTFQDHIDELRSYVSLTKPILITQTASVISSRRDQWLMDMFTNLKAHEQVIGAIYFNRNKDYDYRVLIDGSLDPVFASGYEGWSDPSEVSWIFDGRMDAWVQDRESKYGSGFLDVGGNIFENAVKWLADNDITSGCNPPLNTRFCPDDEVSRGEMAVFVARALRLPSTANDYFTDDDGQFYENAANRLSEAGITQGCGSDRYCGDQPISREQMAAFLARMLELPTTATDFFTDDEQSAFETGINKIAQAGITLGCNPPSNTQFCPYEAVSRGQMAAFLTRALRS